MRSAPRPFVIVLSFLLAAPAWAVDVRAPRCLELADAQGRVVGTVTDVVEQGPKGPLATVITQVDGELYLMQTDGESLYGVDLAGSGIRVWFKTPDCSGTPYIPTASPDPSLFLRTAVAGPGDLLYGQEPGSAVESFEAVLSVQEAGDTNCYPAVPRPILLVPARRVLDLGETYTAPYSVRAGNCSGGNTAPASAPPGAGR